MKLKSFSDELKKMSFTTYKKISHELGIMLNMKIYLNLVIYNNLNTTTKDEIEKYINKNA